jgi:SAM-dependent methyltransferase
MRRQRIAEVMDNPRLDRVAHAAALRSLARTNRLLGADRAVHRTVLSIARAYISVLDVGAGGGALLERLCRKLTRRARHRTLNDGRPASSGHAESPLAIGMDISAQALVLARGWRDPRIRWLCADARALPLADRSIDVVTCTLTLHHFDPPDAARVLAEAARVCRRGLVISDLLRSAAAWAATWGVTRLASRSRIFHVDGPRSVRAAYRTPELADIVRMAGLENACIRRQFPFRMLLTWRKT